MCIRDRPRHIILAHIDPVADNFVFSPDGKVYLIDWEYAAMQDKDIDVAMFAVYSLLDKEYVDCLISLDVYKRQKPASADVSDSTSWRKGGGISRIAKNRSLIIGLNELSSFKCSALLEPRAVSLRISAN